jgi:hypothetical protein
MLDYTFSYAFIHLKSNDELPLKCLYIIVHHWLSFACYFAANLPIFASLNDDFGCLELLVEHDNKDISNDHDGCRLWTFPRTMLDLWNLLKNIGILMSCCSSYCEGG